MSSSDGKKIFSVIQDVRIRSQASRSGAELGWLKTGEQVECDPASRTEAEGHVWWRHDRGWSVERSLDNRWTYLKETPPVFPAATPVQPGATPAVIAPGAVVSPAAAPAPVPAPVPDANANRPSRRVFKVGTAPVRIRSIPNRAGREEGRFQPGDTVEVDTTSRTEADGFVWWRHDRGWSVERALDNSEIYLYDPDKAPAPTPGPAPAISTPPDVNSLPLVGQMFKRFPVDLGMTRWWQYFGNNVFAVQEVWAKGNKWYDYCQRLHGGVDFGNSSSPGVLIYAGIEGGVFDKRDTLYTRPNGMWVRLGDYTIIYGHVDKPRPFNPGDPIGVDTVLGEIQFGGQNHLHLEIRYRGTWLVNPLLFFPQSMQNEILAKFPPGPKYFFSDAGWTQWQTPYDQPVLRLGGPPIGPTAR